MKREISVGIDENKELPKRAYRRFISLDNIIKRVGGSL